LQLSNYWIKKNEIIDFNKRPAGYRYNFWLIYTAILLVTQACLSIRAVCKAFKVFSTVIPAITHIPSRSTIRLWMSKFGLHKLVQPKEVAKDWSIILDHTIQIGKLKILIVLGLRLSHLPFNRSLTLADVQPLALLPMQSSTGQKIEEVLSNLKSELGTIRQVVADQGSDIKLGVNLYREKDADCEYINDIVHKLAHLLQEELKKDRTWEELSKRASESRTKLLQTEYAHLIPPQRRDKARYLNLEELIKWSYRILTGLQGDQLTLKDLEFLFRQFAWVYGLSDGIEELHQLWQITSITRDWVRNFGVQTETATILSTKLQALELNFRSQQFADKILQFVSEQSVKAKPYERLLGTSEIIESLIGLVKHHSNTQSRSGFTGSILIAAALTGKIDEESVFNALTSVKTANVEKWEQTYFAATTQKKRAKFYRETPLMEDERIIQTNGTESGTCIILDFEPEIG